MISRISPSNINNNKINNYNSNKKQDNSPNFGGRLVDVAVDATIKGIQKCEKNPMLNVAIIDLATAIVPRSIWESFTNIFAGFEAFRRESSGLIVNCLIPGFVALGAAKLVNKSIMGEKADLSGCWAGNDAIDTVAEYYKKAPETEAYQEGLSKFKDAKRARVYATHYNMLNEASGIDGNARKVFSEVKDMNISEAAEKLTDATFEEIKGLSFKERMQALGKSIKGMFSKGTKTAKPKTLIEQAYESVSSKSHITENVKFGTAEKGVTSDLKSAMNNSTKLMKGLVSDGAESAEEIGKFANKAKKLVKSKGIIAMAVILPVAASMQYINRWITTKMSGVKGAPIYDDYAAKKDNQTVKTPEQEKADKKALLKQKIISVGSMIGVACLSMMKLPNKEMLKSVFEFKGQFPTMDQARAISTVTFGSRMAVADDKNELAEATTRDIVTFGSMYFLGDYAAKGYASYLENTKGAKLLNRTKPSKQGDNIFKKIGNWIVNTHLKSTDELVSDSVRSLEDMKHLRAKCQMVNLGSSLLILGLLVPVFTRLKTEKNHKKDLLAQSTGVNGANGVNGASENVLSTPNVTQNVTISPKHGNNNSLATFGNMKVNAEKDNSFQSFQTFKQVVERNSNEG